MLILIPEVPRALLASYFSIVLDLVPHRSTITMASESMVCNTSAVPRLKALGQLHARMKSLLQCLTEFLSILGTAGYGPYLISNSV